MADAAIAGGGLGAASAWGARQFKTVAEYYAAEGERRLLWLPVCFGGGIGVYFALTFEPPLWLGFGAALAAGVGAVLLQKHPLLCEAALALAMFCAGFALIGETSWQREAPTLQRRLGPVTVTGRVLDIDFGRSRLASDCGARPLARARCQPPTLAAADPYRSGERPAGAG